MPEFEKYKHHGERHGEEVWVRKDLKGKHRDHCLCFSCQKFFPDAPFNCFIAEHVFTACKRFNLVLPVWECPRFEEG